jgi:ribose 5-phosphate isomerase A
VDADRDFQKRAAAEAAIGEVRDGMLVGIGTGSTVAFAITGLGRRAAAGLRIDCVATSQRSEDAARAAGLTVIPFEAVAAIDLAIDGVDEIDADLRAIKGAGGAMLREKVVASAARRMIAIADATKRVAQLGAAPVPLEVLPFARAFVMRAVGKLGGRPELRGTYRTDQGNIVLDCAFGAIGNPGDLSRRLSAIPGVLGHGLFLDEIDAIYLATGNGVIKSERGAEKTTK